MHISLDLRVVLQIYQGLFIIQKAGSNLEILNWKSWSARDPTACILDCWVRVYVIGRGILDLMWCVAIIFMIRKHHLQYIPVSESFMQVGLGESSRKLLSMKCVVVSFKIKSVKKSAFSNWSNNGLFGISVAFRVCFLMICIKKNLAIASNFAGVYLANQVF